MGLLTPPPPCVRVWYDLVYPLWYTSESSSLIKAWQGFCCNAPLESTSVHHVLPTLSSEPHLLVLLTSLVLQSLSKSNHFYYTWKFTLSLLNTHCLLEVFYWLKSPSITSDQCGTFVLAHLSNLLYLITLNYLFWNSCSWS